MVELQLTRNNLNFLFVFRQSDYYVKQIWRHFIKTNKYFNEFKILCLFPGEINFPIDEYNRKDYLQQTLSKNPINKLNGAVMKHGFLMINIKIQNLDIKLI